MVANIVINTRLSPERRPGRDILLRAIGRSPTQIARRDLGRYYELLEASLQGLKGRFSTNELEALAWGAVNLKAIGVLDSLSQLHAAGEGVVLNGDLCALTGIEDCERFLQQLRELDLISYYALVDAIEQYLTLPLKRQGEEGWREVGLL